MKNKKEGVYYVLLFCATVFWGSSFVFTKQLLAILSPILLIDLRAIIAASVFFIISFFFYRKEMKIEKKDLLILFAFSCFEPFLYFIFETYSLKYSDPAVVSVIIATIPIFVSFLSIYYFREHFTKFNLIGVFISFLGILIMLFPSISYNSISYKGIILAFAAVLSSVGYSFFLRKFPKKYNAVVVITYQNAIGILLFTPLVFILNKPDEIISQTAAVFGSSYVIYLLILAIFCSSIAFIFYLEGVRHFGIGKSNIFTNFIPIITAILSFIIIKEQFTIYKVIGIIIVLTGIFIVEKKNRKISHV